MTTKVKSSKKVVENKPETKKPRIPKAGTTGFIALEMLRDNENVTSDEIAKKVLVKFPESKWNKSHLAWYKHQIRTEKYAFPAKVQKSKK